MRIGSDRYEDDHRKDQIENDGKNIVEDVLPGSGLEHLDWITTMTRRLFSRFDLHHY